MLSRQQPDVATARAALARPDLGLHAFPDRARFLAAVPRAQMLLVDADCVGQERAGPDLQALLSAQSSELPPQLVVLGNADTEPLLRHALRVLARPLQPQALLLAVAAAQQVIEQMQRLQMRASSAETALRRHEELLAMIGHEIRNPLATIQNVLDSISINPQRLAHAVGMLTRQVKHLRGLVDALFDFSYLSTANNELRKETLDLADLMRQALETVRPAFRARGQCVRVQCDDPALEVEGDRARLVQVFANLLDNAGKYSATGQIIEARAYGEDEFAVVTVRDFGEGIAPQDMGLIFEPFVQRASATRRRSGLGLGLAIVRQLVLQHGGTVHATSDGAGRGSTFEVRLRRAAERR